MLVKFVVAGIGVDPNIDTAAAAGLAVDNGIVVDDHCRTSDPFIHATGDCTSFPWQGRRLRLEDGAMLLIWARLWPKICWGRGDVYQGQAVVLV